MTPTPTAATVAMIAGRRSDTERRRQRVLAALSNATTGGGDLSVSAIARRAGVDRTFLYRHRDLLAHIHTAATQPTTVHGNGHAVSRASLEADLAGAHARNGRLTQHVRHLEKRLSELLGQHAWQAAGLGAPHDIDELHRRITTLEQHVTDLTIQLEERGQELAAARAANRELITNLNRRT